MLLVPVRKGFDLPPSWPRQGGGVTTIMVSPFVGNAKNEEEE
jgi:hypothetical protein